MSVISAWGEDSQFNIFIIIILLFLLLLSLFYFISYYLFLDFCNIISIFPLLINNLRFGLDICKTD